MKNFFDPASLAIIGASETPKKIGTILLENLSNWKGRVYPINPNYKKIQGIKAFASVQEIPDAIDLAILAIPAPLVLKVLKECIDRPFPIKNIIIISAGFKESTNQEGKKREEELKDLIQKNKLKVLGPNCLGVINTSNFFNASFAKKDITKGSVGLIAQSGALVTALLDLADSNNFGFSTIATLGNKAGINENEMLKYLENDKNTKVIAMYLENIEQGEIFKKSLLSASKKKPVILIKSGTSQKAQSAIQSHTGAMAGEVEVIREVIYKNGGIMCDNLWDFLNVIKFFNSFAPIKNNQIAIVTNAGGPGVIATDLIEKNPPLELIEFSLKEKEKIKNGLPDECSCNNPIDVLGDADENRYQKVFRFLKDHQTIGAVLSLVTPQAQTPIKKIAQKIVQANKISKFPIIPVFIGENARVKANTILKSKNLSSFGFSLEIIRVLVKVLQYQDFLQNSHKKTKTILNKKRQKSISKIITVKEVLERKVLYYEEAKKIGDFYQLSTVDACYLENIDDLQKKTFTFPRVLKIDDPKILHKNVKDGLRLNLQNNQDLKKAFLELKNNFCESRILTQFQINRGFEVIIGIKKDQSFGHVLLIGLGGILTEIFNQKFIWILPVSKEQIRARLKKSLMEKVFIKQKLNIEELIEEAYRVAIMAEENPFIKELDINPIIFYERDKAKIVDIKIIIE